MAIRQNKNGTWACDLRLKNHPRFYETFESENEARLREIEVRESIKKGMPIAERFNRELLVVPKLSELIARVTRDRWAHQKSASTTNISTTAFLNFVGDVPITRITSKTIADYVFALREEGLVNNTINKRLSSIRVMLKFAFTERMISQLPLIPHFKIEEGRIRWLTYEEEDQIFAEIKSPLQRLFFQIAIETGCRIGEMEQLLWRDIREGQLWVWGFQAKGKTSRAIPLTRKAIALLAEVKLLNVDQHKVFASIKESGETKKVGMSIKRLQEVFAQAKIQAGFEGDDELTPHALRHTCATRLVTAKVHVRMIQDIMGHSDINTTLKYMHIDPAMRSEAGRSLDNLRSRWEGQEVAGEAECQCKCGNCQLTKS